MTQEIYTPRPEHKFIFGLWTVGNRGRDLFGDATRPSLNPITMVKRLNELGAYGVNLHDNDLVSIDATPSERDRIVREFKQALGDYGMEVPMARTNLFYDPVFKDGAFTSSDPRVRLYAIQKTMRSMDLGRARRRRGKCSQRSPGSIEVESRGAQLSLWVLDGPGLRL